MFVPTLGIGLFKGQWQPFVFPLTSTLRTPIPPIRGGGDKLPGSTFLQTEKEAVFDNRCDGVARKRVQERSSRRRRVAIPARKEKEGRKKIFCLSASARKRFEPGSGPGPPRPRKSQCKKKQKRNMEKTKRTVAVGGWCSEDRQGSPWKPGCGRAVNIYRSPSKMETDERKGSAEATVPRMRRPTA